MTPRLPGLARDRLVSTAIAIVMATLSAIPLLSAAPSDGVNGLFSALVVSMVLLSTARPAAGLVALVLALPLSVVIQRELGGVPGSAEIVDALMLSFVCGASLRTAVRGDGRAGRLAGPAAVLALAVTTSTILELKGLQAITPRHPLAPDLWQYVARDYWIAVREFPVVRLAIRWLVWLAAAVYAERVMASTPLARVALPRAWLAAGAVGAALVLNRTFEIALSREAGFWPAVGELLWHVRLSVLQPDVNAAGSHLLLFLVPAVVIGIRQRSAWLLAGGVPVLLVAFGLARSRAAIAAAVGVLCIVSIAHLWRFASGGRIRAAGRPALMVGVLGIGMAAIVATYLATADSHASVGDAMRIRIDLAVAGAEAVKRNPAFGVGLDDYISVTRRFVTPEMTLLRSIAPQGENAHNNFLQIAVELGLPACLVFLWLVWRSVGAGLPPRGASNGAVLEGLASGVLAFLVSAFFGHPLLIPLVGSAFFIVLGLAAGLDETPGSPSNVSQSACWLLSGLYLGSLVWRW